MERNDAIAWAVATGVWLAVLALLVRAREALERRPGATTAA